MWEALKDFWNKLTGKACADDSRITDIRLSSPGSSLNPIEIMKGERVRFVNDTGHEVTTFRFVGRPTAFQPASPPGTPIPDGGIATPPGSKVAWCIQGKVKQKYSFEFNVEDGASTLRTGTIEPI